MKYVSKLIVFFAFLSVLFALGCVQNSPAPTANISDIVESPENYINNSTAIMGIYNLSPSGIPIIEDDKGNKIMLNCSVQNDIEIGKEYLIHGNIEYTEKCSCEHRYVADLSENDASSQFLQWVENNATLKNGTYFFETTSENPKYCFNYNTTTIHFDNNLDWYTATYNCTYLTFDSFIRGLTYSNGTENLNLSDFKLLITKDRNNPVSILPSQNEGWTSVKGDDTRACLSSESRSIEWVETNASYYFFRVYPAGCEGNNCIWEYATMGEYAYLVPKYTIYTDVREEFRCAPNSIEKNYYFQCTEPIEKV